MCCISSQHTVHVTFPLFSGTASRSLRHSIGSLLAGFWRCSQFQSNIQRKHFSSSNCCFFFGTVHFSCVQHAAHLHQSLCGICCVWLEISRSTCGSFIIPLFIYWASYGRYFLWNLSFVLCFSVKGIYQPGKNKLFFELKIHFNPAPLCT